jgi:Hsp70 protein
VRYVPWAAGAVLVLAAIAAVTAVLVPGGPLRASHPSDLWGEWTGARAGQSATPAPSAPGTPGTPPGAPPARVPALFVVEQESPIVAADDTLNESLGIESPRGQFRAVLPKGTPVRYARSVMFNTASDDQKEIRLHILRGRSEELARARSLGWVRVAGLPPGPRGSTRVAVTFEIVDRAIVLVAQNVADGRALPIETAPAPPGFTP